MALYGNVVWNTSWDKEFTNYTYFPEPELVPDRPQWEELPEPVLLAVEVNPTASILAQKMKVYRGGECGDPRSPLSPLASPSPSLPPSFTPPSAIYIACPLPLTCHCHCTLPSFLV